MNAAVTRELAEAHDGFNAPDPAGHAHLCAGVRGDPERIRARFPELVGVPLEPALWLRFSWLRRRPRLLRVWLAGSVLVSRDGQGGFLRLDMPHRSYHAVLRLSGNPVQDGVSLKALLQERGCCIESNFS